MCWVGLKSDLTLGDLGGGLLALLIEVILTSICLFRVVVEICEGGFKSAVGISNQDVLVSLALYGWH